MSKALAFTLPPETMEAIADRAAELVAEKIKPVPMWMTRPEAADCMGWRLSRLEKRHDVPHHHDEGRVFYYRPELDEWMLRKGAGPVAEDHL